MEAQEHILGEVFRARGIGDGARDGGVDRILEPVQQFPQCVRIVGAAALDEVAIGISCHAPDASF